jgi:chromosomal replication initiator protein
MMDAKQDLAGVQMDRSEDAPRHGLAGGSAMRAWNMVRRELLTEFGEAAYRAWLEKLDFIAEEDGVLLFLADNGTAQQRIRELYQARLEARMTAHLGKPVRTSIVVEREISEQTRALLAAQKAEADAETEARNAAAAAVALTDGADAPLHPQSYTFDSFCMDQSNFRAVTVARMIAQGAAGALFPVWLLHSTPGMGKTHLLSAIAHHAAYETPERKVLHISGQEFLESFQTALHRKRETGAFKDMVRAPDLLLIDDFHRIAGKRATEEEALDTIISLTGRGRQVVLAADNGVEGLEGLDERLRSKLRGAATCEIQEPGRDLRRRILEQRMQHYARITPGFSVAPDVLDLLAERLAVSGRELDGAIRQLVIEAKITGGKQVGVDAAMNALQGKLTQAADRRITVQSVQKVVARYYGMTVQQLLERTRRHSVARPRQVAMFLATRMTHASLPDIGQRFGGFDHTTIMYARDRIAKLVDEDVKVRGEIDALAKLVQREP